MPARGAHGDPARTRAARRLLSIERTLRAGRCLFEDFRGQRVLEAGERVLPRATHRGPALANVAGPSLADRGHRQPPAQYYSPLLSVQNRTKSTGRPLEAAERADPLHPKSSFNKINGLAALLLHPHALFPQARARRSDREEMFPQGLPGVDSGARSRPGGDPGDRSISRSASISTTSPPAFR